MARSRPPGRNDRDGVHGGGSRGRNQKTLYVEISRAGDRAELVTDDREALRERLEAATGERIAALEAVEPKNIETREAARETGRSLDRAIERPETQEPAPEMERARAPKRIEHDLGL